MVDGEADEFGLARLPDRVGGLAEFLALEEFDALVGAVMVAHPVEEEGVDRVEFQAREPLVELVDELLRGPGSILGDNEGVLLRLGDGLEELGDGRLGPVGLGRVEVADAFGVGEPQETVEAPPSDFQAPSRR